MRATWGGLGCALVRSERRQGWAVFSNTTPHLFTVYDTVQAAQGKDVTDVVHSGEKNRERPTFPSGGGQALPSFSLISVWKRDK